MLQDTLKRIDVELEANYPEVFNSLNSGATPEQLQQLKDVCFKGGDVPEELEALYKWHNGQNGYGSLNQDENRTFMPIEEVTGAWSFLNNPMEDVLEPISETWIPFTDNGAGDHLMLETSGDNTGSIITYWHDDEARSIYSTSLAEWAEKVLDSAKS